MSANYDAKISESSQKAKDVPINIAGSVLQKAASDLLSDKGLLAELQTAVKGVIPDKAKVQPLLQELANSDKVYSWDEIESIRQGLGKTIRELPTDSPIKGDLIQLRSSIDATLQESAEQAGRPLRKEPVPSPAEEMGHPSVVAASSFGLS